MLTRKRFIGMQTRIVASVGVVIRHWGARAPWRGRCFTVKWMTVDRLSASRPTGSARRAWLIAALLTLANPLLHKSISDVCDAARARWGFEAYNRVALVAIPLVTLLAASPIVIRRRAFLRDRSTLTGVVMLGLISLAAQRWLLVGRGPVRGDVRSARERNAR